MSFFNDLLIARGCSECPTPLWKLKVKDDEYESLRHFLAREYLVKGSFNGYAKEIALFYAEWWKRNPGESTDENQLIRDMGLTTTEATGDAIKSMVENSRKVFDPDSRYYIQGVKLIISNRGREFKYSLFYQGGFPMGKACSKRGVVWSNTIKRFVRTDLNFDGLAGAKIAKKALKEYCTYFVDAARAKKPEGMPFVCNETHPWYLKAVEGITEGDKEREARPFHIKWFVSRKASEFVIKCQIIGPSELQDRFLSSHTEITSMDSVPVHLYIDDKYIDTLVDYQSSGRGTYFSYYDVNRTIVYDGSSKISLRIPGIERPILTSDFDMSIPHSFFLSSNGEYEMGSRFGDRTSLIIFNELWEAIKKDCPHTELKSTFNDNSYTFLTCGAPDDDSEISFTIKNKQTGEQYSFGSEITPSWTEVSIRRPYNPLIIENLCDFSNSEQVEVTEKNNDDDEGIVVSTDDVYFRYDSHSPWENNYLYGKIQCSVIHHGITPSEDKYISPDNNILSVGPNFNVEIVRYHPKECHYKINWDQGKIYAADGKIQPNEQGIWVFKQEEYEGIVTLNCYPNDGKLFNVHIRTVYRDFAIYAPNGEKVKRYEIIPWTEVSSYRYAARGLSTIGIRPYKDNTFSLPVKTNNTDSKESIPEDGPLSAILTPNVLHKYEWRADKGYDFSIRYCDFTLMKYPISLKFDQQTRTLSPTLSLSSDEPAEEYVLENRQHIVDNFKGVLLILNTFGDVIDEIWRNADGVYPFPSYNEKVLIICNQRGYMRPLLFEEEQLGHFSPQNAHNEELDDCSLDSKNWESVNKFLETGLRYDIPLGDLPWIGTVIQNPGKVLALYCRNVILAANDPAKLIDVKNKMNKLLQVGNITFADITTDYFLQVCKCGCFKDEYQRWLQTYGYAESTETTWEAFRMWAAGKVQQLINS